MIDTNSQDRETVCVVCQTPIPAEDIDVQPRRPCRNCGKTGRLYRLTVKERAAAVDSVRAEVVELSADTSATAMTILTTMCRPDCMDDFFRASSRLRQQLRGMHPQALRAIESGDFDPAPGVPFEDEAKRALRYTARELLLEINAAIDRKRFEIAETREARRDRWALFDRLLSFFRGS